MMTSSIHHHIAKFISSQKMESFETQQQVISLGKQLVKELTLESGVDTLSRWMAHYIAEQIINAEKAQGKDKQEFEKRCFNLILQLWSHHDSYPRGKRPFERFEPIFNAMEWLNPDNTYPRYPSLYWTQEKSSSETDFKQKKVQQWVDIALNIDAVAKLLIEFSLKQAIEDAQDENTKEWLKNASDLPNSEDVSTIIRFLPAEVDEKEELKHNVERELKKLKNHIEKLEAFNKFCLQLRDKYNEEVNRLLGIDPSSR